MINQCDGCRRGLPVHSALGSNRLIHRGPGRWNIIGCTAHLYKQEQGASPANDRPSQHGVGMYTTERDNTYEDNWVIRDPDGDFVCVVIGEYSAVALLTHLNRN